MSASSYPRKKAVVRLPIQFLPFIQFRFRRQMQFGSCRAAPDKRYGRLALLALAGFSYCGKGFGDRTNHGDINC